jgi:signal transduction histidine kinase
MVRDKLLIKNVIQMAHDIRSPLFALQVVLQSPGEFNESKKHLLFQATKRLQEIADSILEINPVVKESNLVEMVEEIVSEKRISFPNFLFAFNSTEKNISHHYDPSQMKRIISNLINNSIEAYEQEPGEIYILLNRVNGMTQITIRDYGKGIPLSLIPKIFSSSYNKTGGSGLGLSHAKFYVESIGGKIDITSSVLGTEVSIHV